VRRRDRKLLAQYRGPARLKLSQVPDMEFFVYVGIGELELLYRGQVLKS
jgi:hypothetical protein